MKTNQVNMTQHKYTQVGDNVDFRSVRIGGFCRLRVMNRYLAPEFVS